MTSSQNTPQHFPLYFPKVRSDLFFSNNSFVRDHSLFFNKKVDGWVRPSAYVCLRVDSEISTDYVCLHESQKSDFLEKTKLINAQNFFLRIGQIQEVGKYSK